MRARYWHLADWVIGIDSDLIPVNFNASLLDYLEPPPPSAEADVVLHVRRNGEVLAGCVAFRTQSSFALCFVEAWVGEMQAPFPNGDNGDLLRLLHHLVFPSPHGDEACSDCSIINHDQYNAKYYTCFARTVLKKSLTEAGLLPAGVPPGGILKRGIQLLGFPIRLYFPYTGFFGCLEKFVPNDPADCGTCVPSDVFVHGYKRLGTAFLSAALYECRDDLSSALNDAGFLRKCPMLRAQDMLEYATDRFALYEGRGLDQALGCFVFEGGRVVANRCCPTTPCKILGHPQT